MKGPKKKAAKRLTKTGLSIYRSKDGWRWRWIHENYKIGAESGEAYTNKTDATRGWKDFLADLTEHCAVVEMGGPAVCSMKA